jgi:hypothetical protein
MTHLVGANSPLRTREPSESQNPYQKGFIKELQMNTSVCILALVSFLVSCGTETANTRNATLADNELERDIHQPIAKVFSSDAATFLTQQNRIVAKISNLRRYPAYSIVKIERLDRPGDVATLYICETSPCYSFTGMNLSSLNLEVGSKIIFTVGRFWGSFFWKIENATFVSNNQNLENQFDVNNDGCVSTEDILVIANLYNTRGPHKLDQGNEQPIRFVDINGDGYLSPIDLLLIYKKSIGITFNTCYR